MDAQLEPLIIAWPDLAKKRVLPLKGDGRARTINLKESIQTVKTEVQKRVTRWPIPAGEVSTENGSCQGEVFAFYTAVLADQPLSLRAAAAGIKALGWESSSFRTEDVSDSLIDMLYKQRGSAFVVEALVESLGIRCVAVSYDTGPQFAQVQDPECWGQPEHKSTQGGWTCTGWVRMRRNLAHAPDYADAATLAGKLRAKTSPALPPGRRLLLDFLFPNQDDWAEADAQYYIGLEKTPSIAAVLLLSKQRPDTALALALKASPLLLSRMESRSTFTAACTMLHILGPDGAAAVARCEDPYAATLLPDPALFTMLFTVNAYGEHEKVVQEVLSAYPRRGILALCEALAECRAVSWKMRRDGVRFEAALAQLVSANPARAWGLLPLLSGEAATELRVMAEKYAPPPETAATPVPETTVPAIFFDGPEGVLPLFAQGLVRNPPALKDGTPLPENAARKLTLAVVTHQEAWLRQVTEYLDPQGFADFGWKLFESWLTASAPGEYEGTMRSLAISMDRAQIRVFTDRLSEWASKGGASYRRATNGLEVLRHHASDPALVALLRVAERARSQGLKKAAEYTLSNIAKVRGYTSEELGDRLVPDLGLGAGAQVRLDYGPRQFTGGFDHILEPYVLDPEGKPTKDLPRPLKTDDATLANTTIQSWKDLKKEVKDLAGNQLLRLERAMCEERRWKPELFAALLVGHPLVGMLARRLCWGAWRGADLLGCFRVAEDGSYADVQDSAYTIPEGAVIGLMHPLEIKELSAWQELFASYQLLQPFPQLQRETFKMGVQDYLGSELVRYRNRQVNLGGLLGLARKGWTAARPEDNGMVFRIYRSFQGQNITIELSPGYPITQPMSEPTQTICVRSLNNRTVNPLQSLAPISASELLRDLESL